VTLCVGVVYMLCMWHYVDVVSHTYHVHGTMYMWYCVDVVQWCSAHEALCTHCAGGALYI